MAKHPREISPEQLAAFEGAMSRIKEVTGAHTQVQLAEVLEVRQSSISDAKRRASIPDGWLVKLLRTHQVMPDWILTGEGPRETMGGASVRIAELEQEVQAVRAEAEALSDMVRNALVHAQTTLDDLIAVKRTAGGILERAQEHLGALAPRLNSVAAEVAFLNY